MVQPIRLDPNALQQQIIEMQQQIASMEQENNKRQEDLARVQPLSQPIGKSFSVIVQKDTAGRLAALENPPTLPLSSVFKGAMNSITRGLSIVPHRTFRVDSTEAKRVIGLALQKLPMETCKEVGKLTLTITMQWLLLDLCNRSGVDGYTRAHLGISVSSLFPWTVAGGSLLFLWRRVSRSFHVPTEGASSAIILSSRIPRELSGSHTDSKRNPKDPKEALRLLNVPEDQADDRAVIDARYQAVLRKLEGRLPKLSAPLAKMMQPLIEDCHIAYKTLTQPIKNPLGF